MMNGNACAAIYFTFRARNNSQPFIRVETERNITGENRCRRSSSTQMRAAFNNIIIRYTFTRSTCYYTHRMYYVVLCSRDVRPCIDSRIPESRAASMKDNAAYTLYARACVCVCVHVITIYGHAGRCIYAKRTGDRGAYIIMHAHTYKPDTHPTYTIISLNVYVYEYIIARLTILFYPSMPRPFDGQIYHYHYYCYNYYYYY